MTTHIVGSFAVIERTRNGLLATRKDDPSNGRRLKAHTKPTAEDARLFNVPSSNVACLPTKARSMP